jgi:glycolate oxidase iron-sulfur subunit
MHCGLCLPTCPTFDATKLERNSPRGRIALMRAIADDRLGATKAFADEMYFCLGCLACMSACPAGVNYAELFEHARAEAEQSGVLSSAPRSLIRGFLLRWLFMDLRRLRLAGFCLRIWQRSGLASAVRASGLLKLLPRRWREIEAMTPVLPAQSPPPPIITEAIGQQRYRVAVLTGCVQDVFFPEINRDTISVLSHNGCHVTTPTGQVCCGSLHAHTGEWEAARTLARRQIELIAPEKFDAIITNAGGCGSHLKHYARLLSDDAAFRKRAILWDSKVKDIHEWLMEIGIQLPPNSDRSQVVTYHDSCHLCHGQGVAAAPRKLLSMIPGIKLVELPEASWCCGSAGVYNLVQPEMAGALLERKMNHIRSTSAAVVATGNPGCVLQLVNGARQAGLNLRVVHPVTLLAEAARPQGAGLTGTQSKTAKV